MYEILLVIYLVAALGVIGLVLVQQGKGADMGASFGAGASGTLFGSSGSGNFLTRMTALCATIFFIISLVLGNMSSKHTEEKNSWENLSAPATTQQVQEKTTESAPATTSSENTK
ncbi:preprotein translocase subunit SecG [Photobacterium damselae]|uniref:Protein-export membrane protein SecG n=2 Tax=Photobacterium damselae TaxID=38293 RepID=A0A2T3QK03_PHODM|nr:preprotein translocase subunit SecG [Photobacterium damselae]AWK82706.1 preprotein translocase subunit SecG [Photobacterium damselae]KAB1180997.1 preprotein translocase subunit SecG [Photobacterium damselae subsp. damselae]KAB1184713.1 preprotein translocase subunit SecG [Photobacterium damselae subsp. damselae]MBF7099107.1 preprotein translocase subunit SecG [Photobacterium damselae]MCG3816737.1 preprotein translocase subunit SecG [Photobacterium damselae]